jgi:hypothetical protein
MGIKRSAGKQSRPDQLPYGTPGGKQSVFHSRCPHNSIKPYLVKGQRQSTNKLHFYEDSHIVKEKAIRLLLQINWLSFYEQAGCAGY